MPLTGKIGQYEIVEELGRGAMGEVYKATDTKMFGRTVAVKVLAANLDSADLARSRFRLEVEVAAKLAHPNIVIVYDMGVHGDRDYFVMEYIDGFDVGHLVHNPDLRTFEQKLRIARQICDGLDFAHGRKVVHRDLKPANIMISTGGGKDEVKLVDFGIVHVDRSRLTTERMQPGTYSYMAPEQLRASAGSEVDPRSDLFSLGIVLYELFTGAHPFGDGGTEFLIANNILNGDPEPLRERRPDLPEDLDRLVMRLLEKDIDRRPVRASVVAAELREIEHAAHLVRRRAQAEAAGRDRAAQDRSTSPESVGDRVALLRVELETGHIDDARETLVRMVKDGVTHPEARSLLDRILQITARGVPYQQYFRHLKDARAALDHGDLAEARARASEAGEVWADDAEWREVEAAVATAAAEAVRRHVERGARRVEAAEAATSPESAFAELEVARRAVVDARAVPGSEASDEAIDALESRVELARVEASRRSEARAATPAPAVPPPATVEPAPAPAPRRRLGLIAGVAAVAVVTTVVAVVALRRPEPEPRPAASPPVSEPPAAAVVEPPSSPQPSETPSPEPQPEPPRAVEPSSPPERVAPRRPRPEETPEPEKRVEPAPSPVPAPPPAPVQTRPEPAETRPAEPAIEVPKQAPATVSPTPTPTPAAPSPAEIRAGEIERIREVLAVFKGAYDGRDASALARVWPSAPLQQLQWQFDQLAEQRLDYASPPDVALGPDGRTATARCSVEVASTPAVGRRKTSTRRGSLELTLQKSVESWTITRVHWAIR